MGVDETGVDEVGVDEMGSRRSGKTPSDHQQDLIICTWSLSIIQNKQIRREKKTKLFFIWVFIRDCDQKGNQSICQM